MKYYKIEDDGRIIDQYHGIVFYPVKPPRYLTLRQIFVNQGWRSAWLVDRHEAAFLFGYEMPNGRIFYQEWTAVPYGEKGSFEYCRTINAKQPPVVWRQALEIETEEMQ